MRIHYLAAVIPANTTATGRPATAHGCGRVVAMDRHEGGDEPPVTHTPPPAPSQGPGSALTAGPRAGDTTGGEYRTRPPPISPASDEARTLAACWGTSLRRTGQDVAPAEPGSGRDLSHRARTAARLVRPVGRSTAQNSQAFVAAPAFTALPRCSGWSSPPVEPRRPVGPQRGRRGPHRVGGGEGLPRHQDAVVDELLDGDAIESAAPGPGPGSCPRRRGVGVVALGDC